MSRGNDVDVAVQGMLESSTEHLCYIIEVPADPNVPYTILYPLQQPRGTGSWADPEEDRDFVYQVTCVGFDPRQVRRVQEMVEAGFLGRAEGGDYLFSIEPADGSNTQWRTSDQLGAIVRSGDKLFKSDDNYRVRIGR